MKKINLFLCGLLLGSLAFSEARPVLVEAESFQSIGGWGNDQQYMDQMGSPFVLAHGLGTPVEDAVTTVNFPSLGTYRVWVRTRDWVAPWKKPNTPEPKRAVGTPGIFKLIVNGKPLETTFGTEGEKWHWQDGGTVQIDAPAADLKLHDLTGFEGRCDAVLFSPDLDFVPPNDAPGKWRRELLGISEIPDSAGEFDLVVVGGGAAGMATAISAGQHGLKVALVQNRPVLGGNASKEVRVGYTGAAQIKPYPNLGNLTAQLYWNYKQRMPGKPYAGIPLDTQLDETYQRCARLLDEAGVQVFLNCHVNDAEQDASGRILSVTAQNIVNSRRLRFKARWFADCTGDGNLGFLAGADFDLAYLHMGRTNLWRYEDTNEEQPFPRCPWALDLSDKPFPGRGGEWECPDKRFREVGGWYWESGFLRDPIQDGEYIRDWNFRAMFGAWDVLKNVDQDPVYSKRRLNWIAFIAGMRESRRLMGDLVLTEQDLKSGKEYPDGIIPTSWRIDVHIPNHNFYSGFEGDAFISIAPRENSYYDMPYLIPYRCLYSRNIPNLFMAGRDVSATHHALGAVRVQWTTGMMGELVGMAAALCEKHDCDPRGVYIAHIEELKMMAKAGVPGLETK
jgi:hypothetical protein